MILMRIDASPQSHGAHHFDSVGGVQPNVDQQGGNDVEQLCIAAFGLVE